MGIIFKQNKESSIQQQKRHCYCKAWCIGFLFLCAAAICIKQASWTRQLDHEDHVFIRKHAKDIFKEMSDLCIISSAMMQEPLSFKSYFTNKDSAIVPHPAIRHISTELCQQEKDLRGDANPKFFKPIRKEAGAIVCFKAARTGSTFFTRVITETMRRTDRHVQLLWEPYGSQHCDGDDGNATEQAISLRKILHQKCTLSRELTVKPEKKPAKCTPAARCEPLPLSGNALNPVFITAFNPRFINPKIDWNQVFDGIQRPYIFTLRRTNLVLMSYSKYHHGGCDTKSSVFDLDTLLSCAHNYALGDQELSTSMAFAASRVVGETPHLIVYEDVLSNGPLAQNGVMEHLGIDVTVENIFEENAQTKKRHVKLLCDYADVNCEELTKGLQDSYPCLLKQLMAHDEGLSWSVPMFSNGTISIHGDCSNLGPLTARRPVRVIDELYQLPSNNNNQIARN